MDQTLGRHPAPAASQASKPAEVGLQKELMRLAPLYRIRFTYPESWAVGLDGG
jgi:hypothetical protein